MEYCLQNSTDAHRNLNGISGGGTVYVSELKLVVKDLSIEQSLMSLADQSAEAQDSIYRHVNNLPQEAQVFAYAHFNLIKSKMITKEFATLDVDGRVIEKYTSKQYLDDVSLVMNALDLESYEVSHEISNVLNASQQFEVFKWMSEQENSISLIDQHEKNIKSSLSQFKDLDSIALPTLERPIKIEIHKNKKESYILTVDSLKSASNLINEISSRSISTLKNYGFVLFTTSAF